MGLSGEWLEEERHLAALRAHYPARIALIQRLFRGGQARRSLIARFGQDIVDLAIAELGG